MHSIYDHMVIVFYIGLRVAARLVVRNSAVIEGGHVSVNDTTVLELEFDDTNAKFQYKCSLLLMIQLADRRFGIGNSF